MSRTRLLPRLLMCAVAGGTLGACSDAPLEPSPSAFSPQMHTGAPASSCPLAQLPASAHVLLCFNATLLPAVWHGFLLELSTAQPPGALNGDFTRTRLNHDYVLAAPAGYRKLGATELTFPPSENAHAFQAEFNGSLWYDVVRLHPSSTGGTQTVPIVVFWADPSDVATDITTAVTDLLNAGVVNSGQATALTRKIDQAMNLFAKGQPAEAIAVLQGFIQQVSDFADASILTTAQAALLIGWAQYLIG